MAKKRHPTGKALRFPGGIPQPVPIPPGVSPEVRRLWPRVVHDLIDAGVKLLPVDFMVLRDFCSAVVDLRRHRRILNERILASDETLGSACFRTLETQGITSVCELAGELMLPHGVLARYLTAPEIPMPRPNGKRPPDLTHKSEGEP